MRRRDFITLVSRAIVAWPFAVRSQEPILNRVGYLHPDSPQRMARLLAAFREGLNEVGYVEGRNVMVEYRWAEHENSRLPELVADLVRRQVAVIAVPGSTAAALAAKAATTTIPIIFSIGGDPVQAGLVTSLSRPGGNITGVNSMNTEVAAKRLGLLHELLPSATRFAVLVNPKNATTTQFLRETHTAAAAIGREIEVHSASTTADIDAAFTRLV